MPGPPARRRWLAVAGVLAAVSGGGLYLKLGGPAVRKLLRLPSAHIESPVVDPLDPARPPALRDARASGAVSPTAPVGSDEPWISARPAPAFREERRPSSRGGIDPCKAPDPGWGEYAPGEMRSGSYVTMPREPAPAGTFDIVMHFHGHELALQEFLRARSKFVFLGMTATRYRDRIAGAKALDDLVALTEQAVSERAGKPSRVRRIALAAWSGGYAAISLLLEQSERKPEAVLLFDGLHGSRDLSVLALQLEPIVRYARRALNDQVFMYVSHSSVDTDGYASSTEGVHFLLYALGARPLAVEREDPLGMRLVELYSRGGFHSRGYAGGGKSDHCAHLALYPVALRALERRWR
jgi:hypothetical protein